MSKKEKTPEENFKEINDAYNNINRKIKIRINISHLIGTTIGYLFGTVIILAFLALIKLLVGYLFF
jgi:tetrahydromethanopterin S-methyltransferase subunit G